MVRIVENLVGDWSHLDERIENVTDEIEALARGDASCQQLMTVPGIGPIIASAMVAAIGNGIAFARGRDFAAWLGLVPKQMSTGDRTILGRITKRGNRYLRTLFMQGARVILLRPINWAKHSFTREFVVGTGKYEGMVTDGTVEPLGPFPVIKAGTFQDCNYQTGTYKLKYAAPAVAYRVRSGFDQAMTDTRTISQLEAEGYPWIGCECCKGTVWVLFNMIREKIPALSSWSLDELGAKVKCDRCGKRPERYYPAKQSDAPGFAKGY